MDPIDAPPDPNAGAAVALKVEAEAALQDASRSTLLDVLSRSIPEALADALLVMDGADTIVLVNNQAELMFGYHRSELLGKKPEMLLPEEARSRHIQHRKNYADDPRTREMGAGKDLNARRKSGTEFPVLIRLAPLVIPAGIFTVVTIRRTAA